MGEPVVIGRRERKKAANRQAIAGAALQLFLERGYDAVTVAEIAATADTAVTTLFAHFPDGKESLVFGDRAATSPAREDRGALLAAEIADRNPPSRPLDAIENFIANRGPFAPNPPPGTARRLRLIRETPALRAYARAQWLGATETLAAALAQAARRPHHDTTTVALARFALEAPDLAADAQHPRQALHEIFDHLRAGWPDF